MDDFEVAKKIRENEREQRRKVSLAKSILKRLSLNDTLKKQTSKLTLDWVRNHLVFNHCFICNALNQLSAIKKDEDRPHSPTNSFPACIECVYRKSYLKTFEDMLTLKKNIWLVGYDKAINDFKQSKEELREKQRQYHKTPEAKAKERERMAFRRLDPVFREKERVRSKNIYRRKKGLPILE